MIPLIVAMAEPEAAASSAAPASDERALEEESTAIFKPVVELKEEVKVATGTENEESIFKMCVLRCSLARGGSQPCPVWIVHPVREMG